MRFSMVALFRPLCAFRPCFGGICRRSLLQTDIGLRSLQTNRHSARFDQFFGRLLSPFALYFGCLAAVCCQRQIPNNHAPLGGHFRVE
jgi:hypothetical protein